MAKKTIIKSIAALEELAVDGNVIVKGDLNLEDMDILEGGKIKSIHVKGDLFCDTLVRKIEVEFLTIEGKFIARSADIKAKSLKAKSADIHDIETKTSILVTNGDIIAHNIICGIIEAATIKCHELVARRVLSTHGLNARSVDMSAYTN